ncbi:MAG: metal ABC transporter substrate-binding protein [Patescibacteria group bacterium]|nr:metal ABC transporter substrate-binding protein [Patescibacteria group bacterium]
MKKVYLVCILLICFFVLIGAGCKKESNGKLRVAVTIFPLFDITKNIAGDKIDVIQILSVGASPHTFELTTAKTKELQNVSDIFMIGYGIDNWASSVKKTVGNVNVVTVDKNIDLRTAEGDEGLPEYGNKDPHYWLSIDNAKEISKTIEQELEKIDPVNSQYYKDNLDQYLAKLDEAKKNIDSDLKNINFRKLVTFHDAWEYFADEFDLDIVATFEPFPGSEPTPKYLQDLSNTVKKENVKAIFSEPEFSNETIKPFVNDVGLQLYILDAEGNYYGNSYIENMEGNAKIMREALSS